MTTNDIAVDKLSDQFQTYSQRQFTGRLDVQGSTTWSLYFCLGRLVWAGGGLHQTRRWHRHLIQFCSQVATNGVRLRETDLSQSSWEYLALTVLVKRQKINGEQAVAAIKSAIAEVLFDIIQCAEKEPLTFSTDQEEVLDASLTLINPVQAIQESQQAWLAWREAGLAMISPNLAPLLKQPDELKKLASPGVYQTLVKLVDGKRTLRDLALQVKQDVLVLTRSLVPYIRKQVIGLVKTPDLPRVVLSPTSSPQTNPSAPAESGQQELKERRIAQEPSQQPAPVTHLQSTPNSQLSPVTHPQLVRPLVVYVEDSLQDRRIMEEILTPSRYGFVSIEDSMQALPLLLQHKPDLIFLDLVMPVANGYEICAQIRRISIFKNTPVIILTGNDGIVDRVRAKLVGATDFLNKPIVAPKVLAAIQKHLGSAKTSPQNNAKSLNCQTS